MHYTILIFYTYSQSVTALTVIAAEVIIGTIPRATTKSNLIKRLKPPSAKSSRSDGEWLK